MYSEKISKIVEDISSLNLLEVADLNSLLKARLNISDAPVMMAGAPAAAAPKVEVSNSDIVTWGELLDAGKP